MHEEECVCWYLVNLGSYWVAPLEVCTGIAMVTGYGCVFWGPAVSCSRDASHLGGACGDGSSNLGSNVTHVLHRTLIPNLNFLVRSVLCQTLIPKFNFLSF
jgi:hypothetical protein